MKAISSYLDSRFNDSFTIREAGLKLIPDHEKSIRKGLRGLQDHTPLGTSIDLKFETISSFKIEGTLSIIGLGWELTSIKRGANPLDIYKELENEINLKLLSWKRSRFSDFEKLNTNTNLKLLTKGEAS